MAGLRRLEQCDDMALGISEHCDAPDAGDRHRRENGLAAKALRFGQAPLQVIHLDVDSYVWGDLRRERRDAAVDPSLSTGIHHPIVELGIDLDLPVEEGAIEFVELRPVPRSDLPMN